MSRNLSVVRGIQPVLGLSGATANDIGYDVSERPLRCYGGAQQARWPCRLSAFWRVVS